MTPPFLLRAGGGGRAKQIVLKYSFTHYCRQSTPRVKLAKAVFTGVFNSTLTRDIALPVNATIEDLDNIPLSEVQGFKEPALPWYSDQVLPFDITVAAANEYGAAASCKLFGVEILNEGFGSSVDDSVFEMQATFAGIF
jgi:hypothetical protein